jgi:hypothetical protein
MNQFLYVLQQDKNGKEAERLNKFIWLRIGWLLDQDDEDGALALMMEFADISGT